MPAPTPMFRPVLEPRHRRILTFVVESHVSLAEPVGSQYVRAAYHLSISPATIRNAMQQLEEMGYLSHPHTSAGRVPTEPGYRLYVDELMRPEPLKPGTRRAVDDALRASARRGEPLAAAVPPLLARASRQLALVAVRDGFERALVRADLVRLPDGVILLAVRDSSGRIESTCWTPSVPAGAAAVREAERLVREALPIRNADGAVARAALLRREGPAASRLAADALERAAHVMESVGKSVVGIDGADHIAAQPEFRDADRLRPLVTLLTEREPLARALEASAGDRARVSIGSENGQGPMRHCSLVAIRVTMGETEGLVGVMGPVRMPYRNLVSLVSYVGERLSERTR
ncbi:MAG TPA: heat-inducible transcriptional repressor HrcA [Candidatus Eisenbacteria bacterium]|nr:heat-inducible transcriptional repressor HrcA [Candidatus Eisenbacteria bacterium]